MVLYMKECGIKIKPAAKEDLFIQMEMFITVNGNLIKLMVMEYICILMEHNTKGCGLKINNMDSDVKNGLMEQNMKDNTIWGKNMETEHLVGQMVQAIKDNLIII